MLPVQRFVTQPLINIANTEGGKIACVHTYNKSKRWIFKVPSYNSLKNAVEFL